jgi:hypothetical protein
MPNMLQMINQLSSNPTQIFSMFGIPKECNTPESVTQYLINSGKISQAQINQANNLYRQIFNR